MLPAGVLVSAQGLSPGSTFSKLLIFAAQSLLVEEYHRGYQKMPINLGAASSLDLQNLYPRI